MYQGEPKKRGASRQRTKSTQPGTARATDENHGAYPPVMDDEDRAPVINTRPTRPDQEPRHSTRPTMRDLKAPEASIRAVSSEAPRGQYSISAARGIPTDIVAGTIDGSARPRRRTTSAPPARVHLANVTPRDVTVMIREQPLTLTREDALVLASIIHTALA